MRPNGLAVDARGNIYLADMHTSRIRRVDAVTAMVSTVAGSGVKGYSGDAGAASAAKLALPKGISVDERGNINFADSAMVAYTPAREGAPAVLMVMLLSVS